jgi:hypothetical protein
MIAMPKPADAPVVWWGGPRWVEGAWMQAENRQHIYYELLLTQKAAGRLAPRSGIAMGL